jgi:signal transduction histidine kinase
VRSIINGMEPPSRSCYLALLAAAVTLALASLAAWRALLPYAGLIIVVYAISGSKNLRLVDINTLANCILVYGSLTAVTIGIYVACVDGLGMLLPARGEPVIPFLATGVVVALLQPMRVRLQSAVDRFFYGGRDHPSVVLSQLGQRLEMALEPGPALATVVETVARALKSPYVAFALRNDGGFIVAAAHGQPQGELLHLPLTYADETVGELLLAPRASGEPFSRADDHLLNHLARQAGMAAHAALLTVDLERSRLRLVIAREETRRRLGGDLHDGLGHRLAGLLRKADAAANLLEENPAKVRVQLDEMRQQMRAAIDEVRRLSHALHPPELELLGLVGALSERVAQLSDPGGGLQVQFVAPEGLACPHPAVETAAYYIALEALSNVQRHSGASRCRVCLEFGLSAPGDLPVLTMLDAPVLELEIVDDGRGLAPHVQSGLGLTSMRERALEVGGSCIVESPPGGGTRVLARLPCQEA